ncbi:hypothetical protein ACHAXA_010570 [Cyclostephanos tholiformis]|uniref:DUF6824 domain-containing protein n=1 Tax=Cyclostephanos tholiformis TaxID=382380 RepID=A0ABD3RZB2_9STRA
MDLAVINREDVNTLTTEQPAVALSNNASMVKVAADGEGDPIPPPSPLGLVLMPEPESEPSSEPGHESMVSLVAFEGDIVITDQDVLFGRGGLTNHHIGNLRYRDIISIHRQDYIQAHKTEKPNVARRIVKAIRTGLNPGRFLRKGEDGKWHQVSDKQAAWKASQALREKTRWSSMRQDKNGPQSHVAAVMTMDMSTDQNVVETTRTTIPEKPKKRGAADEGIRVDDNAESPLMKKVKSEEGGSVLPPQQQPVVAIETAPMDMSHIEVPPVAVFETRKPSKMHDLTGFYPRDEDVLFGRGGRTNHHPGNVRLREIVNKYRHAYNQAKKVDKPQVSKSIVSALRRANQPSRFLRYNQGAGRWEDVGDKRAAEKVSQTLREKDQDAKADYIARKTSGKFSEMASAEEMDESQLIPPMPSPEKTRAVDI